MVEPTKPEEEIESLIEFKGADRRTFLKNLAATGGGLIGLNSAIKRTTAQSSDGVPIVYTRDRQGNPEQVRMVSEERHRRLELFENLEVSDIRNGKGRVTSIALKEHDNGELGLHLYLKNNNRETRRKLPDRYSKMPITFEERGYSKPIYECESGDCREGDHFDTMQGNIQIAVFTSDTTQSVGTLGFVAYNDDGSDPYKSLITAAHVVDDRSTNKLYQPCLNVSSSREVGDFVTLSSPSDLDGAKYDASTSAAVGATAESSQKDISGYWTYQGLSDYTSDKKLDVVFAGQKTCGAGMECFEVTTTEILDYQANYHYAYETESGDSGGPYVDGNGKLTGIHSGDIDNNNDGINDYSFGPVANKLLNRLNVTLSKP